MIGVIVAHPDDAELGAGGLLALNKQNALMLSVTHGGYDSIRNNGTRTAKQSHDEMYESAHILGCKCGVWGYSLDVQISMGLVNAIDSIIDIYNIDTIVTHFLYDTHQAHRVIAEAAISAARRVKNLWMMEPPPTSGTTQPFNPQLYVDISSVYKTKHKALKAYTTQREKYDNEWEEAVKGKEVLRGLEIGVERAEAFQIIRTVF